MATYKIARVYEVPADSRAEATDRLIEAFVFGVERDYHVYDVIRPSGDRKQSVRVNLNAPTGWLTLLREQLLGRSKTKMRR